MKCYKVFYRGEQIGVVIDYKQGMIDMIRDWSEVEVVEVERDRLEEIAVDIARYANTGFINPVLPALVS